jgi:hypothetical protein
MKYWKHFTVAAVLALFLLSSCIILPYSYVPHEREPRKVENGVYTLGIPSNFNEKERKFLINRFVQFMSYESYDFELTSPGARGGSDVFTITIPGSIPVENLPVIKKWSAEVHTLDLRF